jgi:hypothetical protein
LKEEVPLWEAFKNLKTARNSFVHEGVARVGGVEINFDKAKALIKSASEIISKVREWIPADLHWPEFKHEIKIEMRQKLV